VFVNREVIEMGRFSVLILVLGLAVLMLLPACASQDTPPVEEVEPAEDAPPPPPPPPPLEEEEVEDVDVEDQEPLELEDVFFDYDKYNIRDEYKSVLEANAELLLSRPGASLMIEGHCDERGTNEYNLALGEKRAKSVMDFYIAFGVDAGRLSMISYGEERPFDGGHDEAAWAKNRRAHMLVKE
jgi:peptidoglycan-associated lipoprotein